MNWKTEALDKLGKYDAMRQAVLNLPEEIARLELAATSLPSVSAQSVRVQGGGRAEDARLNNMMCREELKKQLRQARIWLKTTDRAMMSLSPDERLILHRLYVYPQRGALEQLCVDLELEQSSIYRKRDQALYRFTTALYGGTES